MSATCPDPLSRDCPAVTRPRPLLSGWPAGWFMFCPSRALRRAPLGKQGFGQPLVAFRTASGRAAVLSGRCVHLGADLARGCVIGETLRCPFHHWQFDTQGRCVGIPVPEPIPDDARQLAFPTVERSGGVYFYNGQRPAYPLPFFDAVGLEDLCAAPPFTLLLDCPWYMIGANGVDLQHFATAHDRHLLAPPAIDFPHAQMHRTVTRMGIAGRHLRDRLTRFAGREVRMEVHDWSGTCFLVRASFRHAETFGFVTLLPRTLHQTEVHVVVAVRRSRSLIMQSSFDRLNAWLRRWFIERFLQPDVARSAGTDVANSRLIAADQALADYFHWLHSLHGMPQ